MLFLDTPPFPKESGYCPKKCVCGKVPGRSLRLILWKQVRIKLKIINRISKRAIFLVYGDFRKQQRRNGGVRISQNQTQNRLNLSVKALL